MEDEVEVTEAPSVESTTETSPAPESTQEAPSQFFDPAAFYEILPSQYKDNDLFGKVFEDYNKKYEAELSKYKPYEPFIEQGQEKLNAAVQLFDAMDTREGAERIYKAIGQELGLTTAEVKKAVEEESSEEVEDPGEIDPRDQKIQELEQRQNAIDQHVAEEAQHQLDVKRGNELDTAMREVFNADPTLVGDKIRYEDLMERIYNLNERDGDKVALTAIVKQAHYQQREYNQYLFDTLSKQSGNSPGNSAPIVMAPSGSNPGSSVNAAERTESQRKEAFIEKLRAAQSAIT